MNRHLGRRRFGRRLPGDEAANSALRSERASPNWCRDNPPDCDPT